MPFFAVASEMVFADLSYTIGESQKVLLITCHHCHSATRFGGTFYLSTKSWLGRAEVEYNFRALIKQIVIYYKAGLQFDALVLN
jgi:hypothetical protein